MKTIKIKRLVFTSKYGGDSYISATEYDGKLSNDNILGAFHTIGKTRWINDELWALIDDEPIYRITVETFYQYQKRWYETLLDAVRRL